MPDGRTIGGKISRSGGGVARNVADALGKLQVNPFLISAVGDEPFGTFVLEETIPHLDTSGVMRRRDARTGTCMVLCDHEGECLVVVGDMAIHEKMTREYVRRYEGVIAASSLVVLDGNLSQETTEFVMQICQENSVPVNFDREAIKTLQNAGAIEILPQVCKLTGDINVSSTVSATDLFPALLDASFSEQTRDVNDKFVWFEPTNMFKAAKPFLNKNVPVPAFISPNFTELEKIFEAVHPGRDTRENTNQIEECLRKGYLLAEVIHNIIITLGKSGVIVIRRGEASDPFFSTVGKVKLLERDGPISHRVYAAGAIARHEIMNGSGAGDCFASGFIAAMLKGESEKHCVESGFKCAVASLRSFEAVPKRF